jgi:hypothetical protein
MSQAMVQYLATLILPARDRRHGPGPVLRLPQAARGRLAVTTDIEFLVALSRAILQLCLLGSGTGLTVLLVVVIFSLFGSLE